MHSNTGTVRTHLVFIFHSLKFCTAVSSCLPWKGVTLSEYFRRHLPPIKRFSAHITHQVYSSARTARCGQSEKMKKNPRGRFLPIFIICYRLPSGSIDPLQPPSTPIDFHRHPPISTIGFHAFAPTSINNNQNPPTINAPQLPPKSMDFPQPPSISTDFYRLLRFPPTFPDSHRFVPIFTDFRNEIDRNLSPSPNFHQFRSASIELHQLQPTSLNFDRLYSNPIDFHSLPSTFIEIHRLSIFPQFPSIFRRISSIFPDFYRNRLPATSLNLHSLPSTSINFDRLNSNSIDYH